MSLGDMWAAEVRVTVPRHGAVQVFDRCYWCADMVSLAGREVLVRVPVRHFAAAQVWIGDHYQCSPELIADTGFADCGAAKELLEQYRAKRAAAQAVADEERASVIRGQAKALLDLIDSRVGEVRHLPRILGVLESQTLTRVLKRLARGAGLFGLKSSQNAEQEGVVAFDPGLEKAEAVLKHLHSVFGGHLHGPTAPAVDARDASEADDGAHRLSGGAQ